MSLVTHLLHSLSQGLPGITLLFGTLDPKHDTLDYLAFTGLEHGITHAVWSIMVPEDLTLPAFMGFVTSIMGYKDHALYCPYNWREAMKGNFKPAWKESLFKFLDNAGVMVHLACWLFHPLISASLMQSLPLRTNLMNTIVLRIKKTCLYQGIPTS